MKQQAVQSLKVIARSPFHIYYEGQALAVSAANKVGPFDVLPGHTDFFSVLLPGDVLIQTDENSDPLSFPIKSGILTVRNNEVMLFVNI